MPVSRPESDELEYTMKKIGTTLSNFSAWHHRSKVLTSLWNDGRLDVTKSKEDGAYLRYTSKGYINIRATEFELVRNAMYTDANDQSVWLYHRWLIGPGGLFLPHYSSDSFLCRER